MPAPTPPDDPVEREYRSLARKLHAARGFCFVVYFVDDGRAARRLRERLSGDLGSRGRRLVVLAADAPGPLVASTLAGIFDAARPGDRPVVWVEAFRDGGDPAWDAERRALLMRMNERRSRLEAELRAPLVLLLPGAAQREAASLAPDLWHVRLHSAPLGGGGVAADIVAAPAPPVIASVASPADPVPQAVAYWEAIEAGADASQPLYDGFKAVQAWARAGQPGRAAALAERLVTRARTRVDAGLAGDATPARVELAIALHELGAVRLQLGAAEAATLVLQESIGQLQGAAAGAAEVDGGDAVIASLLSTAQKNLGDALLDAGRPVDAEAQFRASLATLSTVGAAPDAKAAGVAAALRVRIGDAALAAGDTPSALESYRQSVDAWRALAATSGADPALQRSLATALARVGKAEAGAGRGERALRFYAEALALLRAVLPQTVDDASAGREMATLLMRAGQIQQAAGRGSDALAAYAEAQAVLRRLSEQGRDAGDLLAALAGLVESLVEPLAAVDDEEAKAARTLLAAVRTARK